MYFKIFKPISWGKRPAERRSRLIQRFLRCSSHYIIVSGKITEGSGGFFKKIEKIFFGKAENGEKSHKKCLHFRNLNAII